MTQVNCLQTGNRRDFKKDVIKLIFFLVCRSLVCIVSQNIVSQLNREMTNMRRRTSVKGCK